MMSIFDDIFYLVDKVGLSELLGTTVFTTGVVFSTSILQVVLCLLGSILMSIKISGAHLNPLVSIGFFIVDKLTNNTNPTFLNNFDFGKYIGMQLGGALIAGGLVRLLSYKNFNIPPKLNEKEFKDLNKSPGHKFFGEMIGTMVFLSIVLASGSVAKESGIPVPIQVIVGLYTGATIASHWSGGELNPMVSLIQMLTTRSGWSGFTNMLGQIVGLILAIGLLILNGTINL